MQVHEVVESRVSARSVRVWRALVTTLTVAMVAALLPAVPAQAVDVRTPATYRVLGELRSQRLEVRLSDGSLARGNILRFPESDPDINLRSRLARGTVAGTEQMEPFARRELDRGGIAGINGGYFLPRPWGAPNGLFVDAGSMRAGQTVAGNGKPTGRGAVGWQRGAGLVMDRVTVEFDLQRAAGQPPLRFSELNRQVWPQSGDRARSRTGELLLFDDRFGTTVAAPAGSVVMTIDGLAIGSSGSSAGVVAASRTVPTDTNLSVPVGQHLIVAWGDRTDDIDAMTVGEPFEVVSRLAPEATDPAAWEDLYGGLAGGQLMIRDGVRLPTDEWGSFAAFSSAHATGRNPRTAIARTAGGETLLITVDGRRPGWSVGMTVRELADSLLELGATDAVNLDGGGSTTMVVNGGIRNWPSEVGRSVADGVFVYVPQPRAARSLDVACDAQLRFASAAFVDVVAGSTHANAIGCLASWQVTSGITATTYAPDRAVTRAQMATFLARWIDDHADRGSGIALAEQAPLAFGDVSDTGVHAAAIARLAEAGIVTGRSPTVFAPDESVTRAQTATMVARALAHVTGSALPAGRDTFVDDNGSTHEPAIDRLAATGIIGGVGGFEYRPAAPVSRAAMASILMRGSDLLVEQGIATIPGSGPVTAAVPDDGEEPEDEATGPWIEADDRVRVPDGTVPGPGRDALRDLGSLGGDRAVSGDWATGGD